MPPPLRPEEFQPFHLRQEEFHAPGQVSFPTSFATTLRDARRTVELAAVVKHWWHTPLHNQRAQVLKLLLLVRGNQRVIVINILWYL
jgi:hypothetical protein